MIRSVVALAAVLSAFLGPAATAAPSHCPTRGVVARSSDAVVISRFATGVDRVPGARRVFGCLLSRGKLFLLNEKGDQGLDAIARDSIRLAGVFVSYQQNWGSDSGGAFNTVAVRSLRTGRLVHEATVSENAGIDDAATAYALKRTGSLAWIASTYQEDGKIEEPTFEVRAMTAATKIERDRMNLDAPRPLDRAFEIQPHSLRLSRDRSSVSWKHGSELRSARLR